MMQKRMGSVLLSMISAILTILTTMEAVSEETWSGREDMVTTLTMKKKKNKKMKMAEYSNPRTSKLKEREERNSVADSYYFDH